VKLKRGNLQEKQKSISANCKRDDEEDVPASLPIPITEVAGSSRVEKKKTRRPKEGRKISTERQRKRKLVWTQE